MKLREFPKKKTSVSTLEIGIKLRNYKAQKNFFGPIISRENNSKIIKFEKKKKFENISIL